MCIARAREKGPGGHIGSPGWHVGTTNLQNAKEPPEGALCANAGGVLLDDAECVDVHRQNPRHVLRSLAPTLQARGLVNVQDDGLAIDCKIFVYNLFNYCIYAHICINLRV